jgi:hypothetical protein
VLRELFGLITLSLAFGFAHVPAVGAPGDLLQTFINPEPNEGDNFGGSAVAVGDKVLIGQRLPLRRQRDVSEQI